MYSISMRHLLLLAWLAFGQKAASQSVFINEFLASNSSGITDEAGQPEDWIELFNAGPTAVDLGGMYLTDDLAQPTKWQVPTTNPSATTIPPGGFLLLWADGEPLQGILHTSFKLAAGGEDIGLFAAAGNKIDGLSFGAQLPNTSYGRSTDGGGSFQFFNTPTPLGSNIFNTSGNFLQAPTASVMGGFFSSGFEVKLTSTTPSAIVRYTLDGSEPDIYAAVYAAPLQIGQNTTLRARAFAPNHLPSTVTTHTYLFDDPHEFPVVALSFKDADFFDPATGIYTNYAEDWERPVQVEFFETDGMPGFNQAAIAEIHGTGSAQFSQKSLKVKAVANGGSGFFQHPIFPEQPFEAYKNLLLRNGGQDCNITLFRDAFVASLAADLGDLGGVIAPPKLHLQAFRPGVAYLNGQYWGIYNLQEQIKNDYLEQHFDLKESEVDLLENDADAVAGDFDRWNEFMEFLNTHDFGTDEGYEQLDQRLDLPHFLDYTAFNIIIDNSDWPGNNLRRWRQRKADARWRYLSFDFDFSFGLLKIDGSSLLFNTGDASANSLARALDANSATWPNPWWTTLPLRKAVENPQFRVDFINRSADMLNIIFAPDRVGSRIGEFEAQYAPEIQRHFDRWSAGWNQWADNVAILRQFGNDRPAAVRQHFVDYFDEIAGTATVGLAASPVNGGGIQFSTLRLAAEKLPWSGTYFTGVEIPVEADAAPGFVFSKWSNATLSATATANFTLNGDEVLTAIFEKGSTATDGIVINEINANGANGGDWVELYNPNSHEVDLSGWVLADESGGYFGLPANTAIQPGGFQVLVENEGAFSGFYPQANNRLGSFGAGSHGFKLNQNGELITLKNADLKMIDSVRYDDLLPWPSDAGGEGFSLQLTDWELDNALPSAWQAIPPTPGLPNTIAVLPQTIDFQPIGDQYNISLPIVLNATASSGLPVTFTVLDGPATVSGNLLTLTGLTGLVTVRASQQGGGNWQPAVPVLRTFEVKLLHSLDGVYFLPQVQPNPVTNTLGVHFYSNEDGPVRLRVVAVNGAQMMEKKYDLTTGGHYAEIGATDLPKGYFWLVLDGGGQRQSVVPFVKN